MSRDPASIRAASSTADIDDARLLFREYEASLGFDLCFQGFEEELRTLPGRYAPPGGALLLARFGGELAGCVAVRALDAAGRCEMKRLFVRPAHRGRGVGRALATAIVEEARRLGHRVMVLDTLETMAPAITLYRSLGFRDTAPYSNVPLPGPVYLELALSS